MQIHTVEKGETLFSIARKYGTPATKILADNDLFGDRLTIGDELLILRPTRTVTVRGGDTIESISKRFDISRRSILADNPGLFGKNSLRPGQILTVKQEKTPLGVGSALGYIKKGCKRENVTRSLPYLTYLTVCGGVIKDGKIGLSFDVNHYPDIIRGSGRVALLGIKDETGGSFLMEKENRARILDDIIKTARRMNFMGISISANQAANKYPERFCEFLLEGRKKLIGCDMILFTEIFENTPTDASELSDGSILHIDTSSIDNSRAALEKFSSGAESSKVFVNLKSECDIGDGKISINEIKDLCYRSGKELSCDEKTLISGFEYTRYKNGIGEKIYLSFPGLKYTKAKFAALCELGFMGICFDIDTLPMSTVMMFNSSFARADYSMFNTGA